MLLYQFSLDTHPVFTYFSQLNIVLCHCTSLASYSCFCVYSCKGNSYFLLGFRFIRLWKSKLFDGFVKIPSLCQCQKLTEPLIMIQSHHFAQIRGISSSIIAQSSKSQSQKIKQTIIILAISNNFDQILKPEAQFWI